jgi:hypothetical protein
MDDAPREDHQSDQAGLSKLAAEHYAQRGWSVIPIPHRSKNPGFEGWQLLRLTADTIHNHFNGQPRNIGVLLGEPSGWLVDVDLDHPRAVELAAQFLPPTPAIFGRPGKERSHWLYRATGPVATKKHRSKSAGMIVELRSTGAQTAGRYGARGTWGAASKDRKKGADGARGTAASDDQLQPACG